MKTDQLLDSPIECPDCGTVGVDTVWVDDIFSYGSGSRAVQLKVSLPLRRCTSCGFEYMDDVGEQLRHHAVCRHLGVMAPDEVQAIRKKYGLTRAEFAEITRLGEASLARWETGELIQNPANNDFLYLLKYSENLERLKAKNSPHQRSVKTPSQQIGSTLISSDLKSRFRSIAPEAVSDTQREAQAFVL